MKAILEFNLNNPDDVVAHMQCVKACDLAFALWKFSQELVKICDESEDGKHIDEALVRQAFFDILEERDINLDKLVC